MHVCHPSVVHDSAPMGIWPNFIRPSYITLLLRDMEISLYEMDHQEIIYISNWRPLYASLFIGTNPRWLHLYVTRGMGGGSSLNCVPSDSKQVQPLVLHLTFKVIFCFQYYLN